MAQFEFTLQEVDLLRSALTHLRAIGSFDPRLRRVDHLLGRALGCDPVVLYQDALHPRRWDMIRPDGTLDLNAAEEELSSVGEHSPDLNLAERVLAGWRDTHRRP